MRIAREGEAEMADIVRRIGGLDWPRSTASFTSRSCGMSFAFSSTRAKSRGWSRSPWGSEMPRVARNWRRPSSFWSEGRSWTRYMQGWLRRSSSSAAQTLAATMNSSISRCESSRGRGTTATTWPFSFSSTRRSGMSRSRVPRFSSAASRARKAP